ncbi:MerR family transcriptional regulator [Bacillus sp. FJAT-49732]|uniref:MerR family transcriptional regulator n=1 Tax=Lederbergia citrisecunda TaxID=2833583 RepID=A0A942YNH7_9BACI|nr:MerR family transcriptional regulator [Lederbergia citrisecunda]MBS4201725.1 MerR family transcriptional regulator [Lederbergia citrisecunda]
MKEYWKVGELATLTGLTIRTLRYYDQIDLFSPSQYTESGHRLYTKSDLSKLHQILALKQIGLSLEDIKSVITNKEKGSATNINIIETQITRIKRDIQVQQDLLYELESALKTIRSKKLMSVEELTKLLGAMKMYQGKYFTKEQLDMMKNYYDQYDEDTLKEKEQEFRMILKKYY